MFERFAFSRSGTTTVLAAALTLGLAQSGTAQVAWDTPMLTHPFAPSGWSLFIADSDPGDGISAFGAWRGSRLGTDVGVRVGIGEEVGGDAAVFAGVDLTGPLARSGDSPPFALNWVSGFGLGVGDDVLISIPFGIVAGWNVPLEAASIRPYVGPRVVLDGWIGNEGQGARDDLDLGLVVDLGADLVFDEGWAIRFGGTLGDRDGVAVGVTFPTG